MALDIASMQARRHDAVWALSLGTGNGAPLAPMFREQGVKTVTIAKSEGVDIALVARLSAWFSKNRIDIVHLHHPLSRVYAGPAARIAGVRALSTMHGEAPDIARRMWLRRAVTRFVDAFVVVSPPLTATGEYAEAAGTGMIGVIENGIDVTRFYPDANDRARVRADLGASETDWVVGTAGRLSPVKDQAMLLDAIAPLLSRGARLMIAGDGSERNALEARARDLGVRDRVSFLGLVLDVAGFLRALDAFALSSRCEGLPLAMLEAMATGVPVVGTAVGGVPHAMVDGETGIIVPAGDSGAMRAALERLRDHPKEADAIGQRGRASVHQRFSSRRMLDQYSELYLRVLGRAA